MSLREEFAPTRTERKSTASGAETRWDEVDGKLVMPEKQSKFLDWLLSIPKIPPTQKGWAKENDVDPTRLPDWKRDRRFRLEWERRATEMNVSVDRTQGVLDTIHQAAIKGDVQAAKAYLAYVKELSPPKQVDRDDEVIHMSDDELVADIAELMADF